MNRLTEQFLGASTEVFTQADVAVAIDGTDFSRHGLIKRAIAGREIRVRGRTVNAAEIMEMLIKEPAYSSVTAPQAIIKANDGQERFTLTIMLAGEADES